MKKQSGRSLDFISPQILSIIFIGCSCAGGNKQQHFVFSPCTLTARRNWFQNYTQTVTMYIMPLHLRKDLLPISGNVKGSNHAVLLFKFKLDLL